MNPSRSTAWARSSRINPDIIWSACGFHQFQIWQEWDLLKCVVCLRSESKHTTVTNSLYRHTTSANSFCANLTLMHAERSFFCCSFLDDSQRKRILSEWCNAVSVQGSQPISCAVHVMWHHRHRLKLIFLTPLADLCSCFKYKLT